MEGVGDLDEVIDRMRDIAPAASTTVLFVEADDEYFTVLRLGAGDDLRVFGSDAAFVSESRLGAVLLSDAEVDSNGPVDDADPETPVASELDAEPVGEADLLADLGVSASALLSLCGKDGMLPADVIAEVASMAGFGDVLEEVHDA